MAKFVPQPELSLNDQMQIRREKLAALQAEGRDPFVQTKYDFNADSAAVKADYERFEGKTVKVAGRLMSKRGQGKVMFCDLQDHTGRIQIFVKIDELGEEEYNRFKKYDIGDIVGVEGEVLEHHGDVPILGLEVVDHHAVDLHGTLGDLLQTRNHPQGRGFAAAGGADEDHKFLILDVQVEIVNGHDLLVVDLLDVG